MDGVLILVIVVIAAVLIGYLIVKSIGKMIINAVIGLVVLFVVNFFHLMGLAGRPDIGIDWITVLICAFGGVFGAALLIILDLVGITL
jgi:FtsH-binding integral membrane protein